MKERIKSLLAPLDRRDYIFISILGGVNTLSLLAFGIIWMIAFFAVILFLSESNLRIIDDWSDIYILSLVLIALIETAFAGVMIRKLRMWLLSLPLQYGLYFGVLCSYILLLGEEISIVSNTRVALAIVLVQLPGVAVGLLIRLLIRKLRARKQPACAT